MAGSERDLRRIPGLDGLRGLAVLLVVGLHVGKLAGAPSLFQGGFAGVDTFFVLSGFLITSILLSERAHHGGVSFRDFYARRALRLLPALMALLAAHALYTYLDGGDRILEVKAVVAVALYVGNFAQVALDHFPDGLIQTWSLSVEEQFYLVWPLALLFLLRRRPSPRTLVVVALALAALSAVGRVLAFHRWGYKPAYMLPVFRFDGLLIGIAIAFAWRHRLEPGRLLNWLGWLGLAALAAVVVLVPSNAPSGFYYFYALGSLGAGGVLLAILGGRWGLRGVFEWGPLRWVGKVSYGLYLWHPLVFRIVGAHVSAPGAVRALIALSASLAVTVVSWRVVETPFLRLKDRAAPRAAAPDPAPA